MKALILLLGIPFTAFASSGTALLSFDLISFQGTRETLRYEISLAENPVFDHIAQIDIRGNRHEVHTGPVDRIYLPVNVRNEASKGEGARLAQNKFVIRGQYDTSLPQSGGLRFRSGDKMMIHVPAGLLSFPWTGEVTEFTVLGSGDDDQLNSYLIVSMIAGGQAGTYLFIGAQLGMPIQLADDFLRQPVDAEIDEQGRLSIPEFGFLESIGRLLETRRENAESVRIAQKAMPIYPKLNRTEVRPIKVEEFAFSSKTEMTELIALLDHREEMSAFPRAAELVHKAVGGLILRHFPELADLAKSDRTVADAFAGATRALAELWLGGRLSGADIHSVVANRLEVLPAEKNLEKCELALMKTSGKGGHAAAYSKGRARESLKVMKDALAKAPRLQN